MHFLLWDVDYCTFYITKKLFSSNCLFSFLLQNKRLADRQILYLIDRKEVITDLLVIQMRDIYVHVYTRLLICYNHMTIHIA